VVPTVYQGDMESVWVSNEWRLWRIPCFTADYLALALSSSSTA